MKFNNWQEMYNYLTTGKDLYNTETGDYVFEYNDAHALCVYNLDKDEAKMLAEKSAENDGEYWGAFLGIGGNVLDAWEYNDTEHRYSEDEKMRALYLQPSYDYCKEVFAKAGWEDTEVYGKAIAEKNEKSCLNMQWQSTVMARFLQRV